MRKIVLQMMTTLDGRLDEPFAWMHSVDDEQYRDIERRYATFDTVLVGRTTFDEMVGYWPAVLADGEGSDTNRAMARHMHDYRKLVFSRSGDRPLPAWNNSEQVVMPGDAELADYIAGLKAQPGSDIHLAGGASFAQTVVSLGLVDEFRFFVYPVVSPGAAWFTRLSDRHELRLVDTKAYANGVVRLHYTAEKQAVTAIAKRFTELIA